MKRLRSRQINEHGFKVLRAEKLNESTVISQKLKQLPYFQLLTLQKGHFWI